MKLLNFHANGGIHLGAAEGGRVYDLSAAVPDDEALASVVSLLRAGPEGRRRAQQVLARGRSDLGRWYPLNGLVHAPLLTRDCRIFAVGLNYADHAAENNLPPPESPIIFGKLASGITPHGEPIPLPRCTDQVDYEAEFACVIGRRARQVSETEAAVCIGGYTIMNDVTARDLQIKDQQWFRGKNCDGFAPMGPWLVTADEVPDPNNLEITLRLNGTVRQHSNTGQLFFKPPALIAFLSQTLTLEPGDAISTGTPGGVGFYAKPPVFLRAGDVVEVEVQSLGTLRNTVIQSKE